MTTLLFIGIAPAAGLNVGVGHAGSAVAPDMPVIAVVPDMPVIAIVPDVPETDPLLPDIEPLEPLVAPGGGLLPAHPVTAAPHASAAANERTAAPVVKPSL